MGGISNFGIFWLFIVAESNDVDGEKKLRKLLFPSISRGIRLNIFSDTNKYKLVQIETFDGYFPES
jgi:hypothetical protein